MAEVLNFQVDDELYRQLAEIGEVTGEHPIDVAVTILRAGAEARAQAMIKEAEAERQHLEAELTVIKARLAGLNGSSKALRSPVEASPPSGEGKYLPVLTEAVRGILGSDRQRTWTTRDVMGQLEAMGYNSVGNSFYQNVNNTLRTLVRRGEARNPARGQYTWRRRPSNHR